MQCSLRLISETTVQTAQTTVAFESLVPVVFVGLRTWTDLTKRNKSCFVVSAFVGDWVYIESRTWVPAFPKIQMFARLWVLLIVVLYGFIDMKNVKFRRETPSFCWESVNSVNAQIKLRHSPNSYSSVPVVPHKAGGGSFKNRKPIGEVGCCESGMAERSHWWTERCLRSPLFLSLSPTIYLPTYLSIFFLCIYLSIDLSLSLFHVITYLSIYLSVCLSIYLSLSSICQSV